MACARFGRPNQQSTDVDSVMLRTYSETPRNKKPPQTDKIIRQPEVGTSVPLATINHLGRLAQLVRARASHARGHWFESSSAHHLQRRNPLYWKDFQIYAPGRPFDAAGHCFGVLYSRSPGQNVSQAIDVTSPSAVVHMRSHDLTANSQARSFPPSLSCFFLRPTG